MGILNSGGLLPRGAEHRKKELFWKLLPACLPCPLASQFLPVVFQASKQRSVCWLEGVGGVGRIAHYMDIIFLHELHEFQIEDVAVVAI